MTMFANGSSWVAFEQDVNRRFLKTGFLKLLLGRPELPRLSLPRRLSHLPRNSNFQCPQSWMPSLNLGMTCKFLSYACIFP